MFLRLTFTYLARPVTGSGRGDDRKFFVRTVNSDQILRYSAKSWFDHASDELRDGSLIEWRDHNRAASHVTATPDMLDAALEARDLT